MMLSNLVPVICMEVPTLFSQHALMNLKKVKWKFPDKNGEQIKLALRQTQHDVRVAVNQLLFGVIEGVIIT